jgi:hypothetical protein
MCFGLLMDFLARRPSHSSLPDFQLKFSMTKGCWRGRTRPLSIPRLAPTRRPSLGLRAKPPLAILRTDLRRAVVFLSGNMENPFPGLDGDIALDVAVLRSAAEGQKQVVGAHDAGRTDRNEAHHNPRRGCDGREQGAALLSMELAMTHDPSPKGRRQIVTETLY